MLWPLTRKRSPATQRYPLWRVELRLAPTPARLRALMGDRVYRLQLWGAAPERVLAQLEAMAHGDGVRALMEDASGAALWDRGAPPCDCCGQRARVDAAQPCPFCAWQEDSLSLGDLEAGSAINGGRSLADARRRVLCEPDERSLVSVSIARDLPPDVALEGALTLLRRAPTTPADRRALRRALERLPLSPEQRAEARAATLDAGTPEAWLRELLAAPERLEGALMLCAHAAWVPALTEALGAERCARWAERHAQILAARRDGARLRPLDREAAAQLARVAPETLERLQDLGRLPTALRVTLPPRPPAPLEPDPLWPVVKGQPAYGCPCCGLPLPWERGGFFICQSCGWEDDPSDAAYPTSKGGPNHISMAKGREGYWWRSWRGAGRWRPPGHAAPPEQQARALEWLLNKETLTPACEALLMKARGRFELTGPQRARLRAASLQVTDDEAVFIDILENLSACKCALTERRGEAWRPTLEALAEARGQASALSEVMALREAWQRHIASDAERAPWLRQAPDISAFWPDHFEDYERLQRAGYLLPEALEGFEEVEGRLLEDLEHATDDPWDLVYSCDLESLPGWLKLGALSAPTRRHLAERLERALGATPELREHAEPEVLPLLSLL